MCHNLIIFHSPLQKEKKKRKNVYCLGGHQNVMILIMINAWSIIINPSLQKNQNKNCVLIYSCSWPRLTTHVRGACSQSFQIGLAQTLFRAPLNAKQRGVPSKTQPNCYTLKRVIFSTLSLSLSFTSRKWPPRTPPPHLLQPIKPKILFPKISACDFEAIIVILILF